jgi:radical SAM enzyme (TIGR04100 family)
MSEIVYTYGNNIYINLTNECPCQCIFCVRSRGNGIGSAENLWLEADPSPERIIEELARYDLTRYDEAVFCGYGEPFSALDALLETARYLRKDGRVKTRINTNGLGDLINGKKTAPLLEGLVNSVSISLNAPNSTRYAELCRPVFGERAYEAMLEFARECARYVPKIQLSVVDVISDKEIASCRAISERLCLPLRVRHAL